MAQIKAIFSLASGHLIPVISGTHINSVYRLKGMSTNLDIRHMNMVKLRAGHGRKGGALLGF